MHGRRLDTAMHQLRTGRRRVAFEPNRLRAPVGLEAVDTVDHRDPIGPLGIEPG